jgi:hypothetical protein
MRLRYDVVIGKVADKDDDVGSKWRKNQILQKGLQPKVL